MAAASLGAELCDDARLDPDHTDEPLDDEDRAIALITERATRFKMRVALPSMVVGTITGFACAAAVGLQFGKLAIAVCFLCPLLAALGVGITVLRVALPRVVARALVEAAKRFNVSQASLIGVVRSTVLSTPTLRLPGS